MICMDNRGGLTRTPPASTEQASGRPVWPTAANPERSRGNPQPTPSYAAIAALVSVIPSADAHAGDASAELLPAAAVALVSLKLGPGLPKSCHVCHVAAVLGSQVPHQPPGGELVLRTVVSGLKEMHVCILSHWMALICAVHAQVNLNSGVSDGVSSTAGAARVAHTGSLQGNRTSNSTTASAFLRVAHAADIKCNLRSRCAAIDFMRCSYWQ